MSGHVFLSYSRKDSAYVDKLAGHLESAGLTVWLDRDRIGTGDRWIKLIKDQVDSCAALVVVMTPHAEDSEWVELEIERARVKGKPILPLLLEEPVLFALGGYHCDDVRGGNLPPEGFLERLRTITGQVARAASVPILEEAQPKGVPFTVDEAVGRIVAGFQLVASPVSRTLGPRPRPAVLSDAEGRRMTSFDPVVIAQNTVAPDEDGSFGATLARKVVTQMRDTWSDGAATACVMAMAMIRTAADALGEGVNPAGLARQITQRAVHLRRQFARYTRPFKDSDRVTMLHSATHDVEITALVLQAVDAVGALGCIRVGGHDRPRTEVSVVEGTFLPLRGEVRGKSSQVCEDVDVVVMSSSIPTFSVIIDAKQGHKAFVAFGPSEFGGHIVMLAATARSGHHTVHLPVSGDRMEVLADIAMLCGCELTKSFYDPERGKLLWLDTSAGALFDTADRADRTVEMLNALLAQSSEVRTSAERRILSERAGRLLGRQAAILVGQLPFESEEDVAHRRAEIARACDLVACVADGGMVLGRGVTHTRLGSEIAPLGSTTAFSQGEFADAILAAGCEAPIAQLLLNGHTTSDGGDEGVLDAAEVAQAAFDTAVWAVNRFLSVC